MHIVDKQIGVCGWC